MSAEYPRRDWLSPLAERSIVSLLESLPEIDRERLAVDVILQNRRHLQHAQSLFERMPEPGVATPGGGAGADLRHEYHLALVTLTGHHPVVRAVIDALGYVPDVPGETPYDGATGLN